MSTWLLAYSNKFLKADRILFDYISNKKDNRIWIGFESILALAFIRFRPGGKFRFKKGFKIGTDHAHEIKMGHYQVNIQGLKRYLTGGNSADLLNFKTPLFYVDNILSHLKKENRQIIIKISRESIQSLLSTYQKDIIATDALRACDLILETLEKDENPEDIKKYLSISEPYIENPLTKKNHELWIEHIDILNRIAVLFNVAYEEQQAGRNPEIYLNEIKDLQDTIRTKLENFLLEIPHGQS